MNKVATGIRVALAFVALVTLSIAMIPLAVVLLPWRAARVRVFNVTARVLAIVVIGIAGVKLVIRQGDRMRSSFPAIYVTNHVSAFDVFLGMRLAPPGAMGIMTSGVSRVPGYGIIYRLSGHAIIDRAHARDAVTVMREVGEFVKANGLGVWILPEGSRSDDGRLRRFKTGFVQLAIDTGLPVVPVVLHGVHRLWSRKRFPTLETRTIEVDVLPAVDTSGWRTESRRAHAAEVRVLFAAVLHDDQKPIDSIQPD
ncbi:MAG TPA: lysophospholipid acyltransferase family protein [Vicinamibacterales bacterium]